MINVYYFVKYIENSTKKKNVGEHSTIYLLYFAQAFSCLWERYLLRITKTIRKTKIQIRFTFVHSHSTHMCLLKCICMNIIIFFVFNMCFDHSQRE